MSSGTHFWIDLRRGMLQDSGQDEKEIPLGPHRTHALAGPRTVGGASLHCRDRRRARDRSRRHRPLGRPRRRLLRLRERRLVQGDGDPGRPSHVRRVRDRLRTHQPAHRRADPGRGQGRGGSGQRRAQGRRLLHELHGRGRDRGQGAHAGALEARRHRRHRRPAQPEPLSRHDAARRRRRAQLDQLLHRQPARAVGGSGPGRAEPLRPLPDAGRARHARAHVLRRSLAADGRDAGPVPVARREDPRARADRGRRGQGRARRRARAPDRRGAREPRGLVRRQEVEQPLDARSPRHVRSRARLGGVPVGRGPRGAARVRGLASRGRHRASQHSSPASRSTPGRTT